jgi:hypothetical protein
MLILKEVLEELTPGLAPQKMMALFRRFFKFFSIPFCLLPHV